MIKKIEIHVFIQNNHSDRTHLPLSPSTLCVTDRPVGVLRVEAFHQLGDILLQFGVWTPEQLQDCGNTVQFIQSEDLLSHALDSIPG